MPNPRKPDAMKRIRGTFRPCRKAEKGTEIPVLAVLPPPPAWLSAPAALAEWQRAGKILIALGGLTDASLNLFAHTCQLHSSILDAYAAGRIPKPPELAQFLAYAKSFRLVGTSTGLAAPAAAKSVNPFEALKNNWR